MGLPSPSELTGGAPKIHRSQRREEFSKWHETWQDCCLRDSTFFGGSLDEHCDVTNSF